MSLGTSLTFITITVCLVIAGYLSLVLVYMVLNPDYGDVREEMGDYPHDSLLEISLANRVEVDCSQMKKQDIMIDDHSRDELMDLVRCSICYVNLSNVIMLPCLHQSICASCSDRIKRKCPICRSDVKQLLYTWN